MKKYEDINIAKKRFPFDKEKGEKETLETMFKFATFIYSCHNFFPLIQEALRKKEYARISYFLIALLGKYQTVSKELVYPKPLSEAWYKARTGR